MSDEDWFSTAGRLLVASPVINDPNFERTVVLMLQHDRENGAVGVVINRPTAAAVGEVLPEWGELVRNPTVVFSGGPVSVEAAIALGASDGHTRPGWTPVVHDIGTIDLTVPVDELAPHVRGARIYAGYAGWAPDQLEDEIGVGAWFVLDAHPDDALTEDPLALWSAVLARQHGTVRWFSNYPEEPSFN